MNFEKAVLCAVLEEPEAFLELVPQLDEDDFADPRHRSIWTCLKRLMHERERPDAVRIVEMVNLGRIKAEMAYIDELRAYLPSIGEYSTKGAPRWAEHVKERARKRRIRDSLSLVLHEAQNESMSADAVLASAMSALTAHETRNDSDGFIPLSEVRQEFEERLAEWLEGRSIDKEETGFPRLDHRIGGGLAKGHLYVLGGRPGSFKTGFAWLIMKNIAQAVLKEGKGGCVAFASLEMKRVDIVLRAVCAEALVDSTKLEAGQLSAAEKRRVRRVTEEILKLPVRIYDGIATSEFLHWQTLNMMAHEDVRLLVIDFAEMVADKNKNEEQRVSDIFRAAKEIAKVRNIPVMILSQLSRNVERTTSRIPGLQDLRWGGAGEAVADNVWFAYFPWMYQARGETIQVPPDLGFHSLDTEYGSGREVKEKVNKSKWFLIIAKSRYGGLGHVKFNVVPEYTLIVDYDEQTERDGVVHLKPATEDEF